MPAMVKRKRYFHQKGTKDTEKIVFCGSDFSREGFGRPPSRLCDLCNDGDFTRDRCFAFVGAALAAKKVALTFAAEAAPTSSPYLLLLWREKINFPQRYGERLFFSQSR